MAPYVAAAIFLVTYALIATDRLDKTVAALLGGLLMVVLGILDPERPFEAVDLEVIFLLAGMMVLAAVLGQTGFFQALAIRSVKIAGGRPFALMAVLSVITAALSAFLDNVTTVVLLAPVTLYVAAVLRVNPVPFLIAEIFASNVGGTATLIGDPPNILIGTAAGLDFGAFLVNLGPVALVGFALLLVLLRMLFHGSLEVDPVTRDAVLALDEREAITNAHLMRRGLAVLAATIVGFLVLPAFGVGSATVALLGATVMLLVGRIAPGEVLREIEWPTLFFFIGLFLLVAGVVEVGIIDALADRLFELTAGHPTATTLGVLWLSGIASAIVDNIPYTATMIPLVEGLGDRGVPTGPIWWALALGADFGGNATIIGASANVVVANVAARAGHPIGFRTFVRYGLPVTIALLLLSSGYLLLRYL